MKRKNLVAILMLTLGGALAVSVSTRPTAAGGGNVAGTKEYDFNLGVGGRVFWPSEPVNVDRATVLDPARICNTDGRTPCYWEYKLRLAEGGTRLRVALGVVLQDQGDVRLWADNVALAPPDMLFKLQLFDPVNKETVADTCEVTPQEDPITHQMKDTAACEKSTDVNFSSYAIELLAKEPKTGVWTVRVIPTSVLKMAFRMRAKLEGPDEDADPSLVSTSGTVPLSPNLRAIPPFEFSFNAPVATNGPGVDTPGVHASCMPEEVREAVEEAVRKGENPAAAVPTLCLRFSMGLENAGDGPFRLKGYFAFREGQVSEDKPMTQERKYSNDTWKEDGFEKAGTGRLDPAHGHLHWQNAYQFDLFRVDNPGWRPGDKKPRLDLVGPGRKLGVSPTNEHMADWTRFYQGRVDEVFPDLGNYPGCTDPTNTYLCHYDEEISLQTGWGDLYEWNRSGNYVAIPQRLQASGVPMDGYYLMLGKTDPEGVVIETNEKDNVSYALIQILRDCPDCRTVTVKLLERGYGSGPWDPHKRVLTEAP